MAVKNYDPNKLNIVFGPVIITGFADGTFLTVAYNNDAYTVQIGTDGEGCRSKSNDKSATFTLTLAQWGIVNAELSAIYQADDLAGTGALPFMVTDQNGTTVYAAETAWIRKLPDSGFDREAGSREWVFETDKLTGFVGGSS